MMKSSQHPGLAVVYDSLFGFTGDEFYIKEWPQLIGCTFGDIVFRFTNAVPIGILEQASRGAEANIVMNPPVCLICAIFLHQKSI